SAIASSPSVGACVSKSGTLTHRVGNPEPRLYVDDKEGVINSMGIPNYGYLSYLEYFRRLRITVGTSKPFIQSVCPFDLDELEIMLYQIDRNLDINFPEQK